MQRSIIMENCIQLYIKLFIFHLVSLVAASVETTISVTTPIDEIIEGGILSVHCQVWNLREKHDVSIFRTTRSGTDRISLNDNVPPEVDNRVYLAVRQAPGGSRIYFLSVIEASRQDEGLYSCKVINTVGTITQVAEDSIDLKVMYFPSDSDPLCSTNKPSMVVVVGERIALNCSSNVAYPEVSLRWIQQGSTVSRDTYVQNGRKYEIVTIEIGLNDQGSVFQCELRSEVFPGRIRSCHIGPVSVSGLDGNQQPVPIPSENVPSHLPNKPTFPIQTGLEDNGKSPAWDKLECQKTCSYHSPKVLYWIIGTIVACAFAILFFVIFIGIMLRYRRLHFGTEILSTPRLRDDIYSELDNRSLACKRVYISLDRQKTRPPETLQ